MATKKTQSYTGVTDPKLLLLRPRVTEKSAALGEQNVYTFDVSPRATKLTVMKAVKELYKVDAVKVAMIRIPAKRVFVRGKWGVKTGGKKALVYLEKRKTIEFV